MIKEKVFNFGHGALFVYGVWSFFPFYSCELVCGKRVRTSLIQSQTCWKLVQNLFLRSLMKYIFQLRKLERWDNFIRRRGEGVLLHVSLEFSNIISKIFALVLPLCLQNLTCWKIVDLQTHSIIIILSDHISDRKKSTKFEKQ